MKYALDDIKRQVRVLMDENAEDVLTPVGDVDALGLDKLIEGVTVDVLRAILLTAPASDLGDGKQLRGGIAWESGMEGVGMGSLVLPDDYLRLVYVQMSDWAYGLSDAISSESDQYRLQRGRWGAGRGTPERPVAAVVPQTVGLTLELYSSAGGPGVYLRRGRYIAEPQIEEDGTVEVPSKLLRPLVRGIAGEVLKVLNPGLRSAELEGGASE